MILTGLLVLASIVYILVAVAMFHASLYSGQSPGRAVANAALWPLIPIALACLVFEFRKLPLVGCICRFLERLPFT